MDIMILGGAALAGLILFSLAGFVMKKPKTRILLMGFVGLAAGGWAGYLAAPVIISFM